MLVQSPPNEEVHETLSCEEIQDDVDRSTIVPRRRALSPWISQPDGSIGNILVVSHMPRVQETPSIRFSSDSNRAV
jgi:hypothetical protein